MLVGLVGPEHQLSALKSQIEQVRGVRAFGLGDSIDTMRLGDAKKLDLVHFIFAPVGCNILSQRNLLHLAIIKKPVVFHWIGSDVVSALHHPSGKFVAKLCRSSIFVKSHLAQTSWLAKELLGVGIQAVVFPNLPNLDFIAPPFPERPSVLAYLPNVRYAFYGGKIVERLAAEFPSVRFLGLACSNQSKLRNLRFLPWQTDMDRIWLSSWILLRVTQHDGLPWMVLEAMAKRRHVIFTYDFPFCYKARSYDEAKASLSEVLVNWKPNVQGATFVRKNFNPRTQAQRLVRIYEAVLAGEDNPAIASHAYGTSLETFSEQNNV